jgi:RND family efflux transporter MFP subunit
MVMSNLVRIVIFTLIVAILSGCGEKIKPGEQKVERPLVEGVALEKVLPGKVTEFYDTSGTVKSRNTSIVSAKVTGTVNDIEVNVSDNVQKGDVLLVIRSPDIEARVKAASEALGEAGKALRMSEEHNALMEKTFKRFEKLYIEKAVSDQEFDEIKTKREIAALEYSLAQKSLKKAEAALEEAEAFRSYSIVRSPVNGIIADKKIDRGSMAMPGMPLVIIEELQYRVEAPVDESMISLITIGSPVEITIDALGIKTTGKVGEIVRTIDPATRTFMVKINVNEKVDLLRSGFYARTRFPVARQSKLFINEKAVVTRGELKCVYEVDDSGVIRLRILKTGKKHNGRIEVLSGLHGGERIIVNGVDKAVDGGRIR